MRPQSFRMSPPPRTSKRVPAFLATLEVRNQARRWAFLNKCSPSSCSHANHKVRWHVLFWGTQYFWFSWTETERRRRKVLVQQSKWKIDVETAIEVGFCNLFYIPILTHYIGNVSVAKFPVNTSFGLDLKKKSLRPS